MSANNALIDANTIRGNNDIRNDPNYWMYSGNFITNSDERIKTDIRPVPSNCSELISKIEPFTYQTDYGGPTARIPDDACHWGFVAQHVEREMEAFGMPFAGVVTDENGIKYLAYSELIAVLWAALREMGKRLDDAGIA